MLCFQILKLNFSFSDNQIVKREKNGDACDDSDVIKTNHNNNIDTDNMEDIEEDRRLSLHKHVDQLASVVGRKVDGATSFSYSMEKYLDPNRPFKCDVCKESFTQKNILLVHYNSVSHLHKLKKIMQEQQLRKEAGEDISTPEKSAPMSKGSALEALLGNIRGEKKEDEEAKLYKCNICKVAYSQGSTLDIHIRSVLHQGRASRLQELILTGQIDMNKPLIEQPDAQQIQEQQKKMLAADMLSPKSLNSTGSSNPRTSPNVRGSSSPTRESPQSSPLANLQSIMAAKANASPSDPSSSSDESAFGNLAKTFPFLPALSNFSPPANSVSTPDKKAQSPVLKNLLQNYGFDLMKQFNEMQRKNEGAKDSDEAIDQKERSTPSSVLSESRDKEMQREKDEAQSGNFSDVQEAFQRAMMNAQLQQMNPLLMQMAQLQGLNPLLAMNIHPPLIPPNMMKQGHGMDMPAAILAQLQSTQQLLGNQAHAFGLFPGAGSGMDPKLLALMSATRQQQMDMSQDSKPPASVMNLINQGQSSSENSKNLLQMAQMGMPMNDKANDGPKNQFGGSAPPPPNYNMQHDQNSMMLQQQNQNNSEKRARTRITDDQLKVLRSNFDINNSPAEEQLTNMSAQTGLPLKVIKHWFRNTLFKERQKNKDSPYNFNNPPSTKLNLEEYEKTGESKVTPLHPDEQAEYAHKEIDRSQNDSCEPASSPEPIEVKQVTQNAESTNSAINATNKVPNFMNESPLEGSNMTLSRLLSVSQLSGMSPLPSQHNPMLPNFPAFPPMSTHLPTTSSSSPLLPDYLNSMSRSPRPLSPCMSMGGSGKRANRTRFTDYQIKVLQEFFENNAYPKDDDLEYLSKLLGLSPRVIVVWFQNARQKARKIYENQPSTEAPITEEEEGRFTRTAGCNYQCKKCLLVFQRYYELIRHQKQHCFKEEDAKRSAQAQKAAAHAAAQFSTSGHTVLVPSHSEDSKSSIGDDRGSMTSPVCSTPSMLDASREHRQSLEDNRAMYYRSAEMEETISKIMQQQQQQQMPGSFMKYPSNSAFGILQQQALQQQQQQRQRKEEMDNRDDDNDSDGFDSDSNVSSPSAKRRCYDDGEPDNEESLHQKEKRLRTSILPEQLDFLYQKYAQESNPTRKMLEQIAGEVGLRKQVVKVWFQNTRARERKGQFQSHSQLVINKRCPLCPEIFKMRTALEAHLATMHPTEQIGMIDIDALPDLSDHSDNEDDIPSTPLPMPTQNVHNRPSMSESPFPSNDHLASLMPNSTSAFDLQNSMRKYYEDTMKRFMNDITEQQKRNSIQEALDLSMEEGDYAGDGDSDANKSMETESNGGGSGSFSGLGGMGGSGNKRFRTQMSGLQVKMMKSVFENYKTPTMTECANLGRDIGLQKRVVQVWFQNARAKEKRAKLQLQQALGHEPEQPPPPEECVVCNFKYGPKYIIQDHIFNKNHLEQVKLAIEHGRYDPESPGFVLAQTAAAIMTSNGGGHHSPSPSGPAPEGATSLSMLQMTTQVNNGHDLMELSSRQNSRMLMQV